MDATNFVYFLKGYFELNDSHQQLSAQQVQIIKDHLDLVFNKVTPNYSVYTDYSQSTLLNDIQPYIQHSC